MIFKGDRKAQGIMLRFYDRHGEHVDPSLPLCDHNEGRARVLEVGDTWKGRACIGEETLVEVELHYTKEGHIDVILNHLDYIIAKAKRANNLCYTGSAHE